MSRDGTWRSASATRITRQTGSHIRVTGAGGHALTVPDHKALKTGTLSAVIRQLSQHHDLTRDEVLERLFA